MTTTVGSITALKSALANNAITDIVVLNGVYAISPSSATGPLSLWIGSLASGGFGFAERTAPVTVRAQTIGGVIFDGGNAAGFGALSFEDGAHHQTWIGFRFRNMRGSLTGVLEFGGYSPRRAPHHITLEDFTIEASCHVSAPGSQLEHGIYFAHALAPDGPHHITIRRLDIEATDADSVWSGLHFFHGDAANPGTTDLLVEDLTINGTKVGLIFWNETLRRITIRNATITGADDNSVRWEGYGEEIVPGAHADGVLLDNVVHSGAGVPIFTSNDYLGLTIVGGNLGEAGGGATGEDGGGTGGGDDGSGSGDDDDHFYSFRFGGPEDGGWSSDGVSGTTSFSDNAVGFLAEDGVTYHVHVEMDQPSHGGYAPAFWIGHTHSTDDAILFDTSAGGGDFPSVQPLTHDHDFTTVDVNNVARMQAHASAAGSHGHEELVTVSGWVDPDGWTPPEPPTPPPPPPGPIIDVYDPDDVFLATLPAKDVRIRRELNGVGSGAFKINRYAAEATAAILKKDNYVRVTIPQIDPRPIFGFFLDDGDFKLVATGEKGAEMIGFSGKGGLSYWTRAIWLAESFLVDWVPAFIRTAHGAPPAGTVGAVHYAPGDYRRFTHTAGVITSRIDFTTGVGFSSYYDQRRRVDDGSGNKVTLVHLTTGGVAGWWVRPYGSGVTDYPKKSAYTFGNSVLMDSIDASHRPGAIVAAMYGEAFAADRPINPIPAMTIDFDDVDDSNGDAWSTTVGLLGTSAALGDDYLSTIGKLIETGILDVDMGPDLDMHAYNAFGQDRTSSTFASGKVRLVKGVNIADELVREVSNQDPIGTFAEVLGPNDGDVGRALLAGDYVPREISVRGDTSDVDALEAIGDAVLASRLLHGETVAFNVATPKVGQENELAGLYLPGQAWTANGNYDVGDFARLDTGSGEHDFDELDVRIAAITLWFTDANDLRVGVEVGSSLGGLEILGYPSSSGGGPTSTGGIGGGPGGPGTSDLYQLVSERDKPNGYPTLTDDGEIAPAEIPVVERLRTDETDADLVLKPDGAGGLVFTAGTGGFIPTYIAPDETFTVPADRQALFAMPIENDGDLIVDGYLIEVN